MRGHALGRVIWSNASSGQMQLGFSPQRGIQRSPRAELSAAQSDDFSREVYCINGLPIDAIEISAALHKIDVAIANKLPFLVSTPNLNFIVISQTDPQFRESLLLSDVCLPDGMPVVWIAWVLGIPIQARIAGADLFEALASRQCSASRLKVFLLGGAKGVAEAACRNLNFRRGGLRCVGYLYPGFGTVEDMSHREITDRINAASADMLVVSLGAQKGQLWLQRNHRHLTLPVRAHLGATINFAAGTVARAPRMLQKIGLEWLWRVREEPYLWRRYWHDGVVLLRLLITHVLPLAAFVRWLQFVEVRKEGQDLVITCLQRDQETLLSFSGFATARNAGLAISHFRNALVISHSIVLDLSGVRFFDFRLLGLVLMLRKQLKERGKTMTIVGVSPRLKRLFHLSGASYLLDPN
jgi:N-acetylglucosaminyldiphosphoundecaprenol N-acetyl-beta-D-mannosaminyltransferase